MRSIRHPAALAALLLPALATLAAAQGTPPTSLAQVPASPAAPRPMTFLDVQHMRQIGPRR